MYLEGSECQNYVEIATVSFKKIEIVLFSGILETNSFGIIGCDLPKASLSMITFNENND